RGAKAMNSNTLTIAPPAELPPMLDAILRPGRDPLLIYCGLLLLAAGAGFADWRHGASYALAVAVLITLFLGGTVLLDRRRTKTRRLARTLRANNQPPLLDTVLNNMSQGVLMFDSQARLVFCNQRYLTMYGLSPEYAKPGCTLRDLLNLRIAAGTFSGSPERYIANLLGVIAKGKTTTDIVESCDGRVFAIVNTPLAGGGWLATHEDITERQRAEERIAHMARHDSLTDLPNRVLLRERLEHELKRVNRGECLAVLCLDLDHFKSVNDTLGHPIGDTLLKAVADRLRTCVRETDTIARLGGDEFAIIMTSIEEAPDAALRSN